MVVKMMKWRPWPPIFTKKFQVNLTLHCLEGFPSITGKSGELGISSATKKLGELSKVLVNVKWKGSKSGLGSRFRSHKRARTTEKVLEDGCIVNWEEEFQHVCTLVIAKDKAFMPWEIHFVLMQVGTKSKLSVLGTAVMNLADFASPTEHTKQTTKVRVLSSGGTDNQSALVVTVSFLELRTNELLILDRFMAPSLPCLSGPLPRNKSDHQFHEESSEKKLNAKRSSPANGKKNSGELDLLSDGKLSPRSDQSSGDAGDPFTSDSIDDSEEEEIVHGDDHHFQSYGSLAGVNLVVEGALPFGNGNRRRGERMLSFGSMASIDSIAKAFDETCTSDSDQGVTQPSMRSILSWRKRKLSFRSPRARGEPLLNKSYGEDGGDDIDYFRRLSGLPIEPLPALCQKVEEGTLNANIAVDFGEEHFSVGSWEKKDIVSRDGQMRLSANVFFASIDQRSERAAGESACTALVAVIADWLHRNPDRMPIKAEFDTLIREGSAEWRKLCEIETYKDRFPDGHFDLDTVLQAKIRSLTVAPERSFIGFFQPEGVGDSCNFLQGAMSFDNIWEAIWDEKPDGSFSPAVYIVSWNDHFFVLKVERDAYYILDTLGERLFEGCNQAYILCFDKESSLCHVPKSDGIGERDSSGSSASSGEASSSTLPATSATSSTSQQSNLPQQSAPQAGPQEKEAECAASDGQNAESAVVYTGKDACKQFLKGFFAALPLRELQIDIKKGLLGKIPLHQRLQIEFHFTSLMLGQ